MHKKLRKLHGQLTILVLFSFGGGFVFFGVGGGGGGGVGRGGGGRGLVGFGVSRVFEFVKGVLGWRA